MIYILCRQNEDETLTAIGLDLSEAAAKALADDGDFLVVPIQIGKVYNDIVSAGIVGAVTFNNTSLGTIVSAARSAILGLRDDIQTLHGEITTLQGQISQGSAAIQSLNNRVTDLEDA